jgi:ParB/RepB/Spo0J family partition protein
MANVIEVPLNRILVKDRQREDYGDLTGLAASINRWGQLQNILVEPPNEEGNYALVAGGRRLAGIAAAGKNSALAKIYEGPLDDLALQELELEENIQRKDLSWQEKEKAVANIHRVKQRSAEKEGKTWSTQDTANLIGQSLRRVQNALELTKAVENNPDVAAADTAFGAMQRLTRQKDLKRRQEDVEVRRLAEKVGMKQKVDVQFVNLDAAEAMKDIGSETQDFVITNPPFGVDIEDVFTSDKKIYEDNPDEISALCRKVFHEAYRILKPDRWFVAFYPTLKLDEARRFLAEAGFKFQKVPAVWVKPNKRVGNVGDGTQALVIGYEQFFFARKGDARFHEAPPTNNVFSFDTPDSSRMHPLQMPPELWEAILRLITLRGERGVEPFSGSGSGGIAAIRRDLHYLGIELDPEYVARARTWVAEEFEGKDHAAGSIEILNEEIPF